MLKNAYLDAKIGGDTAELASSQSAADALREELRAASDQATAERRRERSGPFDAALELRGSFSSVSTPISASKI